MKGSAGTGQKVGGLRAAFGCSSLANFDKQFNCFILINTVTPEIFSPEALALFRICLGSLLVAELILRFRFLHVFYSDEGTMPLRLLLPKIDDLYRTVCLHCHFGSLSAQQVLLGIQTFVGVLFTVGYQTRITAILSWYLYTSLILRNTWLYFILDRYFYYLLFLSMFLPLDERWSLSRTKSSPQYGIFISPATVGIKLLILWIYIDAGGGKLMDPKKGWTYGADPLPALDTYTRHTVAAQYIYAIMGPEGLRVMTPIVVWVELLAAPVAFLGSYFGKDGLVRFAVGMILQLHIGISMSIRNAVLLSLVACAAWCVFLPLGWEEERRGLREHRPKGGFLASLLIPGLFIGGMAAANIWFETIGASCASSNTRQIWPTLLQNRWNVFIGAEEYVTWEIAPGRLADGSVVDVWGRTDEINWHMPGSGAPCTSTSRPGRWRSFPYLAGLEGEDAEALWGYLCKQWDIENDVVNHPGRKLLRYNFFMLQADVLPNMGFSATRKRLVYEYNCTASFDETEQEQEEESKTEAYITKSSGHGKDGGAKEEL